MIKKSVGIACCRRNNNRMEILLVRKRCTYEYSSFVLGRYNRKDTSILTKMFNNMTFEEKLTILSFNFDQMWYRLFLDTSEKLEFYRKAKIKFDILMVHCGTKQLTGLINCSTNNVTGWEIPKGRFEQNEFELDCAIREFEEETGIAKKNYRFIPDFKRTYSFYADRVNYVYVYYMALLCKPCNIKVKITNFEQICEISDIKWMTKEKIIDLEDKRLEKLARPMLNFAKSHIKY